MKKYESKRHAGVFAYTDGVVDADDNVVIWMDNSDKQTVIKQTISTDTFKRWWKEVIDDFLDIDAGKILVETAEDVMANLEK